MTNLRKCFHSNKSLINEYKKKTVDLHTYIWIYLKNVEKPLNIINIKRARKKVKKINFLVRLKSKQIKIKNKINVQNTNNKNYVSFKKEIFEIN